ncbi:MAG: response regulator, partial [Anaerolineae bacterium]
MNKLRILLVDDHEVVRLGLRSLLERHPDLVVVGEAETANDAIRAVESLAPDVVVLDIRLPGRSGVEACAEIKRRRPETKIVILTSYAEDEVLLDAIVAGAEGYVLKQVGSDDLVQALRRVGRGEQLLDPRLTSQVFARLRKMRERERAEAFADLSEQELRVLALVTEGKTNRQIGEALYLSERTVRNYVSDILAKLGHTSRAQAAAYA